LQAWCRQPFGGLRRRLDRGWRGWEVATIIREGYRIPCHRLVNDRPVNDKVDRQPTPGRRKNLGAIEGTRTPTPLRVHGPEPCASANSATMAKSDSITGRPLRGTFQER